MESDSLLANSKIYSGKTLDTEILYPENVSQDDFDMMTFATKIAELEYFLESFQSSGSVSTIASNLLFEADILSGDRNFFLSSDENVFLDTPPLSSSVVIRDVGVFPIIYENKKWVISEYPAHLSSAVDAQIQEVLEHATNVTHECLEKQVDHISAMLKYAEKEKGNFLKKTGSAAALAIEKNFGFSFDILENGGKSQALLRSYNYDYNHTAITGDADVVLHYRSVDKKGNAGDVDIHINSTTGRYKAVSLLSPDNVFVYRGNSTFENIDPRSKEYHDIEEESVLLENSFLTPEIREHIIKVSKHAEFRLKEKILHESFEKGHIKSAERLLGILQKECRMNQIVLNHTR